MQIHDSNLGFHNSSEARNERHILVKLESIEQDFPIIEEYEFNVPNIHTSCYCSCKSLKESGNDDRCHYGELDELGDETKSLKLSFNKTLSHGICKG